MACSKVRSDATKDPPSEGGIWGDWKTLNPKKVYFGGKGWDLPLTEVRAAWALWARRAPLPLHTLNPKVRAVGTRKGQLRRPTRTALLAL